MRRNWWRVWKSSRKSNTKLIHRLINDENNIVKILSDAVEKNFQMTINQDTREKLFRNYSEISKARKMLGFEPKIELKEGLKSIL